MSKASLLVWSGFFMWAGSVAGCNSAPAPSGSADAVKFMLIQEVDRLGAQYLLWEEAGKLKVQPTDGSAAAAEELRGEWRSMAKVEGTLRKELARISATETPAAKGRYRGRVRFECIHDNGVTTYTLPFSIESSVSDCFPPGCEGSVQLLYAVGQGMSKSSQFSFIETGQTGMPIGGPPKPLKQP